MFRIIISNLTAYMTPPFMPTQYRPLNLRFWQTWQIFPARSDRTSWHQPEHAEFEHDRKRTGQKMQNRILKQSGPGI